MAQEKNNGANAMMKLAAFIVDKRNLFFLLLVIGVIFSASALPRTPSLPSDLTSSAKSVSAYTRSSPSRESNKPYFSSK